MKWWPLLVLAMTAAVAAAPTPVALNPPNTDGVVYGTLRITDLAGRACMNIELLSSDPSPLSDGEFWCVHTEDRHQCCIFVDGLAHCWDAIAPPTPAVMGEPQYLLNTMTPTQTPTPTITGTITPDVGPQYLANTATPTRTPTATFTPTVTPP